jgi:hypothetical protein
MFALQAPLFRGTLQVPNQAIGVAIQFHGLTKQGWKSAIDLSPDHWTAAMNLTNTQFANRGKAQQRIIKRKRVPAKK